jgi:hypothetical protein
MKQPETKKQVEALRNHLKSLSNFSSWHLIRDELQQIVVDLENGLFEPDAEKNKVVWTTHDMNREMRKLLNLLINLPTNLFDELKDFDHIPDEIQDEDL